MKPTDKRRRTRGEMAYHAGASAETAVLRLYEEKGFEVAARRWRGTSGELDLVLRDRATVVFVEVKKSRSFDAAALSLSAGQIARLFATAEEFLAGEPAGLLTETRFDLALVDGSGQVLVHENALVG